jgi:hypothetical protein
MAVGKNKIQQNKKKNKKQNKKENKKEKKKEKKIDSDEEVGDDIKDTDSKKKISIKPENERKEIKFEINSKNIVETQCEGTRIIIL